MALLLVLFSTTCHGSPVCLGEQSHTFPYFLTVCVDIFLFFSALFPPSIIGRVPQFWCLPMQCLLIYLDRGFCKFERDFQGRGFAAFFFLYILRKQPGCLYFFFLILFPLSLCAPSSFLWDLVLCVFIWFCFPCVRGHCFGLFLGPPAANSSCLVFPDSGSGIKKAESWGAFLVGGYNLGVCCCPWEGVMLLELSTERIWRFAEQGEVEILFPEDQVCVVAL